MLLPSPPHIMQPSTQFNKPTSYRRTSITTHCISECISLSTEENCKSMTAHLGHANALYHFLVTHKTSQHTEQDMHMNLCIKKNWVLQPWRRFNLCDSLYILWSGNNFLRCCILNLQGSYTNKGQMKCPWISIRKGKATQTRRLSRENVWPSDWRGRTFHWR